MDDLKPIPTYKKQDSLPVAIYILCLGIFAMVTSEFQVSGMIPVMADDLGVPKLAISFPFMLSPWLLVAHC